MFERLRMWFRLKRANAAVIEANVFLAMANKLAPGRVPSSVSDVRLPDESVEMVNVITRLMDLAQQHYAGEELDEIDLQKVGAAIVGSSEIRGLLGMARERITEARAQEAFDLVLTRAEASVRRG